MNDRLVPILSAAVIALLAICTVVSVVSFSGAREANSAAKKAKVNTDRLNAVVTRLDVGSTVQCQRVQRLRDDVNAQANNQFDVIKVAAKSSPDSRARAFYQAFLDATPYSPPTDCKLASINPLAYRAPPLVPFASIDRCYSAKHNRPVPPCRK